MSLLPIDSIERKQHPLHSGCFAFFPHVFHRAVVAMSERELNSVNSDRLGTSLVVAVLRAPTAQCNALHALVLAMEYARRQLLGERATPLPDDCAGRAVAMLPVFSALAQVAVEGNRKHCGGDGVLRHRRGVSGDHLDAAARHVLEAFGPEPTDADGLLHIVKAVWRYAAYLQEMFELQGEPIAPAASFEG